MNDLRKTPSVFVSSTCYDLKQIREDMKEFIENNYGFAAILSELGIWAVPGLSFHGLTGNISFLCVDFFLMGLLGGVSVRNKADLEEDAHLAMLAD